MIQPAARAAWLADFSASMVVFLVALPLCMGIAIASGAPPLYGIISGIIGGIFVGFFTGSPLQVSGPAAGLTILVWDLIEKFGLEALGLVVLIGGFIQFLCGQLRLGQWFRAMSPSVIYGMLTGIGILIASSQFHVMIDDKPRGGGLANLLSIPESIMKGLGGAHWNDFGNPEVMTSHNLAAFLGIATITILMAWKTSAPKRLQFIPAPLAAIGLTTIVAFLFHLPINYVDVPNNVLNAIPWPPTFLNHFSLLKDTSVWFDILGLAFIASAETLLSATALDKLHKGPKADYDKELSAQGLGNMLCGLVGVLPITGVIVRSAANVQAGAYSNRSTIMHGIWLLLFFLVAEPLLRIIPMSSLAAILVYTGFKLMDFKVVPELLKHGKSEVAIFAITIIMIVVDDLLTGVLVGLGLSLAKLIYIFSHLSILQITDEETGMIHVHLKGAATFIRLPQLAATFQGLPTEAKVMVHVKNLSYIDHACLELFQEWEAQHRPEGGHIIIDWEARNSRAIAQASTALVL